MHLVYLTRNLINGKIYIGVHSQKNSDFDGYFGSGKKIRAAIKKYGRSNFIRETIIECENRKEADEWEALIVDENFIAAKDSYNIKTGGRSLWKHSEETKSLIREKRVFQTPVKHSAETLMQMSQIKLGKKFTKEHRDNISKGHLGIKQSEETIEKRMLHVRGVPKPERSQEHCENLSKSLKAKPFQKRPWQSESRTGKKRGTYKKDGSVWAFNEELKISRKYRKEEIPEGWEIGRKICWT